MIQAVSVFLEYLFDFTPPTAFGLQAVIWALLAINLVLAIAIAIWLQVSGSKLLRKLFGGFTARFLVIEAFMAINLFSRLNRVDVISMRFITYLLLIWLAVSYVDLLVTVFKKWPAQKQLAQQKEPAKHKYHIHKNKKRHS